MKYKLINSVSKIETICDKVVVDGFDYYVMTTHIESCWVITDNDKLVKVGKSNYENWHEFNSKKVIATNNPNMDIPKVVDEVDYECMKDQNGGINGMWVRGYNKCQETHLFSEEDMVEFVEFVNDNAVRNTEGTWMLFDNPKNMLTTKQLLQLWKEQKTKTVWYE